MISTMAETFDPRKISNCHADSQGRALGEGPFCGPPPLPCFGKDTGILAEEFLFQQGFTLGEHWYQRS